VLKKINGDEMTDKKFKILFLKKFSELQEPTDRKVSKIVKTIHKGRSLTKKKKQ
jgi:hypothetical protein